MSTDRKTTALGAIAGALLAASVDWTRALAGDGGELARIGAAAIIAALGYFARDRDS